jgi:hypothetical protein
MAITPIKFKLPTVEDIKPKIGFSFQDTTQKLSFTPTPEVKPFKNTWVETAAQFFGYGDRPSAFRETLDPVIGTIQNIFPGFSPSRWKEEIRGLKEDPVWQKVPYWTRVKYLYQGEIKAVSDIAGGIVKDAIKFIATPAIGTVEEIYNMSLGEVKLPGKIGDMLGPLTGTRTQVEEAKKIGLKGVEPEALVVAQQMARSLAFVQVFGLLPYLEYLYNKPKIDALYKNLRELDISEPGAKELIESGKMRVGDRPGTWVSRVEGQPDTYVIVKKTPNFGTIESKTYSINPGDTWGVIIDKFDYVSPEQIITANPQINWKLINTETPIPVGANLKIPGVTLPANYSISAFHQTDPGVQLHTSVVYQNTPAVPLPKGVEVLDVNIVPPGVISYFNTMPPSRAAGALFQESLNRAFPTFAKNISLPTLPELSSLALPEFPALFPIGLTIQEVPVAPMGTQIKEAYLQSRIQDIVAHGRLAKTQPKIVEKLTGIDLSGVTTATEFVNKVKDQLTIPEQQIISGEISRNVGEINANIKNVATEPDTAESFLEPITVPKAVPFEAKLYRGTVKGPEDKSLGEYWSNDPNVATMHGLEKSGMTNLPAANNIVAVVKLENPLYIKETGDAGFQELAKNIPELKPILEKLKNPKITFAEARELTVQRERLIQDYLRKQGYDGVVYKEGKVVLKLPIQPAKAEVPIKEVKPEVTKPAITIKVSPIPLSDEAFKFVDLWMGRRNTQAISKLTSDIEREFAKYYRPEKPVLLYRANKIGTDFKNTYTSWTYDKKMAEEIAKDDKTKEVISKTIDPKDILIDFTRLAKEDFQFENNEVIVKPQAITPKEVKVTKIEEAEGRKIYQQEFERIQTTYEDKMMSDIRSLGGLKTDPTLKEEMSDLPINIMRKDGVLPDEMLDMLDARGYDLKSVSDMFDSIRAISSMPTRYKPAESVVEQKLTTIRAIRTKMPKIKEVTTAQLERLERRLIKEATVGRNIPPKQVIAKVTGLKPEPEKMITKKESQLLKMKLRAEAKGATEGMREARAEIISQLRITRTDTSDIRKQITDYVKQALDPKDRGKANVLIRDAKDQEDLVKAFIRIDTWAENAEKKAIRNDVISSVKKAIESPAVAVDYKAKIKEVIDEFELKGHLGRTLEKLQATKKYIDERLSAGEDIEIPQRIWNSLKILTRKPYDELTISELKGLQDEVKILDVVGRMKWATFKDIYNLEQTAIKDALVEGTTPMERKEKITAKIGERLSTSQAFKNHVISMQNEAQKVDKVVLPMDALFDWLDGAKGTFSGANMRLIKNKIDRGWNLYQTLKDDIQDPIVEKAIQLKMKDTNMERIGFVAAREQEGGMAKLEQLGYTEDEVNAVKLTTDEQTMLDMMRGAMEKEYPYVVDIMRKVYNQPVGKVKNYFSFMTDWSKTDEAEIYKRMGPGAEEFGLPTKTVEQGFTIPRRAMAKQKIKLNAMSIFLRHTDNTSYLRALGRDIKMLFEIANSDEYRKASGDLGQLLVLEWLDLMARKGGSAGAKKIALIDTMRKNIGVGMIGLKLSSAAVQWTEVIPAMGLIGPEYGMKGIFNVATSHDWREFIMKFPEIRNRAGGETAIRELIDGSAFRKLQAKAFVPLQLVDTWGATSVAAGAYEKKMRELGKEIDLSKEPNQEAMEYAQQIVRRNQGVAGYKDVPLAISRGALTGSTSIDRAFLQFQNFVLFRWSRIRYEALKVGGETKDPLKAAGILFWTLVGMIAAVGTKMGVDALSDFVTGKVRKDTQAMKKMIYEIVGSVPFLGNLYGSYLYDNELIPIFSAPSEALQDLKKALTSKNANTRARGLSGFITTLMTLMGVPGMLQTEQLLKKAIPSETPKQLMPPSKKSPTPPAPSKPGSLKPKSSVENLLANIFKRELA